MTGDELTRLNLLDLGLFVGAPRLRLRAPRAKAATRRGRDRRRDLADDLRPRFGPDARTGHRDRVEQHPRVRMRGLLVDDVGRSDLTDLPERPHDQAVA